MRRVIVDGPGADLLRQADGLIEVRDTSGNVLGFFASVKIDDATLAVKAAVGIDPWDLLRARREPEKGVPISVVLARLKELERNAAAPSCGPRDRP